ncbi:MAG: DUF1659 domain-containing protein [Sporolactobacillus sp.]
MAKGTIVSSALVLTFADGVDASGKTVKATKSFRNIRAGAPYDDLLAVANKLWPLQQQALIAVERVDNLAISE